MRRIKKNTEYLIDKARELRNNMTPWERHLWYDFLKQLPITVHRQKCIGNFIVDFYIPCALLAIEIDGYQHTTKDGRRKDTSRDSLLDEYGIKVIRFKNSDIDYRFQSVCAEIMRHILLP